MHRYYVEQRIWLSGAEVIWAKTRRRSRLDLGEQLAPGAHATVRRCREWFSTFDSKGEVDHLRIDFGEAAVRILAQRVHREGFHLVRLIPRISQYGYLSLTSICRLDAEVQLEKVEVVGVKLALEIDSQVFPLLAGICAMLETEGALAFPYRYRFGVMEGLHGDEHGPAWAYGLNQHVLLPSADLVQIAVPAMHIRRPTKLRLGPFQGMGGWTVFVWAPVRPMGDREMVRRFADRVTLDNVLAVQLTVVACGLSLARAILDRVMRASRQVEAAAVRHAWLVHHRIEQRMKLRERELTEAQRRYVRAQFARSDYDDLRAAYDRAEASTLSAATGLEAARLQRSTEWTNLILTITTVLGALTVFTAVVDFGYWMPVDQAAADPGARRLSLFLAGLLLLAAIVVVADLILRLRARHGRRVFGWLHRRFPRLMARFGHPPEEPGAASGRTHVGGGGGERSRAPSGA